MKIRAFHFIKKMVAVLLTAVAVITSAVPARVMAATVNYEGTWVNITKNISISVEGDSAYLAEGQYSFTFSSPSIGTVVSNVYITKPTSAKIKNGSFSILLDVITFPISMEKAYIMLNGSFTSQDKLSVYASYEERYVSAKDNSGTFTLHKKAGEDQYMNILPDTDKKLTEGLWCLNDAAWNGKKYIIAGRGRILSSTDGKKWSVAFKSDYDHVLTGIVWSGKEFVAVGNNEKDGSLWIVKSKDGVKWQEFTQSSDAYVTSIAYNGKLYVITTFTGIFTSSNGEKWTKVTLPGDAQSFGKVIYQGNTFVSVGNNYETGSSTLYYSKDGKKWKKATAASDSALLVGVTYMNKTFYMFEQSDSGCTLVSTKDFKTFDKKDVTAIFGNDNINYLDTDGSRLFVYYNSSTENNISGVMSSKDSSKWTKELDLQYPLNNMVCLNNKLLLIGPQLLYISK